MAVAVTVRGTFQSPAVKVSDAGLTVTASLLPVPSGPRTAGVTVTSPVGSEVSATAQVARVSSPGVAGSSASATVTDRSVTSETVTNATSFSVTVTRTSGTSTPSKPPPEAACAIVARRSPPMRWSRTPATVTVRGVCQSAAVKVSDSGLTVTASLLPVPSAPRAAGVRVVSPVGRASRVTVYVAAPTSATRSEDGETATPSVLVTVTGSDVRALPTWKGAVPVSRTRTSASGQSSGVSSPPAVTVTVRGSSQSSLVNAGRLRGETVSDGGSQEEARTSGVRVVPASGRTAGRKVKVAAPPSATSSEEGETSTPASSSGMATWTPGNARL